MKEAEFQRSVMQALRLMGWRFAHFHDSRRQVRPGVFVGDKDAKGFPDIFAVKGSRALALELKGEKTRISEEQLVWIALLRDAGIEAHIWRPGDFDPQVLA